MMRTGIRAASLLSAIALVGCGSGSDSDDAVSLPTPIPVSPAPAPTPTPVPAPTPSPVAPTGVTISTEAASALIGVLQFEGENGQTARWATDYIGRFPPVDGWLATNSLTSPGFTPDYTRPLYTLSTTGIDRNSQLLVSSTAPAGATVVSPLTGLIGSVGDKSITRAALQLGTTYPISPSTDLLTTSGVGADSAAIAAANVRTVLLWRMVDASMFGVGALPLTYTPFNLVNRNAEIATFIRSNPSVQLYTQAGAERLLRTLGQRAIDDKTIHAMAHLITIYAEATTAIVADRSQAARYMLGIGGYLDELIRELRSNQGTPSYAAKVEALTAADVITGVATFALPAPTSRNTFFVGPDFDFLAPGASGSRPSFNQNRLAPASSPATYGWAENDFTFNPVTLSFDPDYNVARIVGVTVPAQFAGKITASAQNDMRLSYSALAGFSGTAYFDYLVDDGAGHQATARFFLIVR